MVNVNILHVSSVFVSMLAFRYSPHGMDVNSVLFIYYDQLMVTLVFTALFSS